MPTAYSNVLLIQEEEKLIQKNYQKEFFDKNRKQTIKIKNPCHRFFFFKVIKDLQNKKKTNQ